jgi:RNA polymerase sigma factor (sigma-70 family)
MPSLALRSSWLPAVGYSPRSMPQEAVLGREEALSRVRARILAAARSRLSAADAEDMTQEALFLLATKYTHVSRPEELVAIGVRIVAFKRMAFWRKTARRRAAGDTPLPAEATDVDPLDRPDDAPDPEEIAWVRQRLAMFVEAAARLDGRCRQILRRKLEGASFVEIADELGRPVNTVYSWDHRCHQRLKSILAERWAFVSGAAR